MMTMNSIVGNRPEQELACALHYFGKDKHKILLKFKDHEVGCSLSKFYYYCIPKFIT